MNIFIDSQDSEERYGEELYKEYLEKENKELKEKLEKAIEFIKSYNSTIKSRNELGIYVDFMIIPKELLEILGDKENENNYN